MKKFFFLLLIIFSLECFSIVIYNIPMYPGFSNVELVGSGDPNFPSLRPGNIFYLQARFYTQYQFSCPLRLMMKFINANTGREEVYLSEDVYGRAMTYPGNSNVEMEINTMIPDMPTGMYWVYIYLDELRGTPLVGGRFLLSIL